MLRQMAKHSEIEESCNKTVYLIEPKTKNKSPLPIIFTTGFMIPWLFGCHFMPIDVTQCFVAEKNIGISTRYSLPTSTPVVQYYLPLKP